MKIENLKQLQKVIQVCRKQGVTSIKMEGLELILGAQPKAPQAYVPEHNDDPLADAIVPAYSPVHQETAQETASRLVKDAGMTDEQMLMWSSVGPADHLIEGQ